MPQRNTAPGEGARLAWPDLFEHSCKCASPTQTHACTRYLARPPAHPNPPTAPPLVTCQLDTLASQQFNSLRCAQQRGAGMYRLLVQLVNDWVAK